MHYAKFPKATDDGEAEIFRRVRAWKSGVIQLWNILKGKVKQAAVKSAKSSNPEPQELISGLLCTGDVAPMLRNSTGGGAHD